MKITLEVVTVKIGTSWIAATSLGGIQVRGRRADTVSDSVRALFWKLANRDDDDAATAIDLAAEGLVLSDALTELNAGD